MTKDNVLLGKFELNGLSPAPRGVPQIEVTFEIDANGILNVGAEDKASGKAEKITITADKGRLSQEEIERMVREAEEFAEEDKAMKEKIDARNGLEGYAFSLRNSITDKEKFGDKISSEDKETLEAAIKETTDWLEEHPDADKDEFLEKQKELEAIANPVMTKLYQQYGGPQGGPTGQAPEEDFPEHDDL